MQLYLALRYWSAPTSFIALVTLYGYSLVIYLPIAVRRVSRVASACELTRRRRFGTDSLRGACGCCAMAHRARRRGHR